MEARFDPDDPRLMYGPDRRRPQNQKPHFPQSTREMGHSVSFFWQLTTGN